MLKMEAKSILALFLRFLLSGIFFYTALVKVHPIGYFEFTLVETGWIGWDLASFLARGLIGLEFAFSILLLIGTEWRKVLSGILIFLVIMSLYLIVLLIQKGNVADCGCLGGHHSITPLMSLLKNAGMIGMVLGIVILGGGPSLPFYPRTIAFLITLGGLCVPFIAVPIETGDAEIKENAELKGFPMEELKKLEATKEMELRLDSGKHILAFMSTTCHWCQLATRKMGIMDDRTERDLPYYFFLHGTKASEERFWKKARSGPYPSRRIQLEKVVKYADGLLPSLVLVEDGVARARFRFKDITQERIMSFLED